MDGRLVIGTRRYSSWSMRGWLAVRLAALDVAVEVVPLAGQGGTPAIRQASPSGLVPYLEHRDARVWESLAICEYCAEIAPALWPEERRVRAHARAIAAEMHAGFRALRVAMPMNLGRAHPAAAVAPEVEADIARIAAIWHRTRERFGAGGPFLFGGAFGAADAMYAPVVARLLSYRPRHLPHDAAAYCEAVRAHALVAEWYSDAEAEPAAWRLAHYEAAP